MCAQVMSPDMPLPPASTLAATRFTIGDFDVSSIEIKSKKFFWLKT